MFAEPGGEPAAEREARPELPPFADLPRTPRRPYSQARSLKPPSDPEIPGAEWSAPIHSAWKRFLWRWRRN